MCVYLYLTTISLKQHSFHARANWHYEFESLAPTTVPSEPATVLPVLDSSTEGWCSCLELIETKLANCQIDVLVDEEEISWIVRVKKCLVTGVIINA